MKSKLGFHVDIQGHQGQIEKMIRADIRVLKVITSVGMLRDVHHALGDKTIFIARDWKVTDDFLRFGARDNPKDAAKRWLDGMRPSIVQAPFAYWEAFNEMSDWGSMRQYGEFEAERQRLMAAEGFNACIGNFSTGSPPISNAPDDTTREDRWADFYPALEVAHELRNLLGLHEYGGLWMDMWYGSNQNEELRSGRRVPFPETREEGWLFGRYRKVWRRHIVPNGWTNIRVALTELGLDRAATTITQELAGYATGPWRSCADAWRRLDGENNAEDFYFRQLQWVDRQLQKDAYVVGATIFTWGTLSPIWGEFEINGNIAESLVNYIQATKDDTPPPDPRVEPSIFVTPIPAEGLWLRRGPGREYAAVDLTHPGDKLGALEPEATVVQKIGKDGQWLNIRTPADAEGFVAAWLVERFGAPPIPDPTTEKVYVTPIQATGVYLRSGAGTQYEQLEILYMGDQLELLEPRPDVIASIGKAGQWLKIRTPRNRNGWVEAWLVQRAYVGPRPDQPPSHTGPLYLRTNSSTGIYIRRGPGAQYQPIASAFPADRLEALGNPDAVRAVLGQRGQWLQVKTSQSLVGWASAFYLEVMPPYYVWPGGHALVGLHGPADPGEWPWDGGAYDVIRVGRIQAVKLLAAADIGATVVNQLRQLGVRFIMARLFEKITEPLPPQRFVEDVAPATLRLYHSGIRYFEVHNEPNLHSAVSPEGMGIAWHNGREFGQYFLDVVAQMRSIVPGAQFGFPGLSPGPDDPREGRVSSEVFMAQAESAARQADFVCMHTYWGGDNSTYLDSVGKVRAFCDRFANQLVFVTEFSNTHKLVGKDVKGREYASFYTEVQKLQPNLGALFSYALSASHGYPEQMWKGSPIPQAVGSRSFT